MLKCSDLSKIGWLILNNEKNNSFKLISEEYIRNMCSDIVSSTDPFRWNDKECSAGYGYFLWKCKNLQRYRIWGAGGNFSVIDFPLHRCSTLTAVRNNTNWQLYNDQNLLRLIMKHFLFFNYVIHVQYEYNSIK